MQSDGLFRVGTQYLLIDVSGIGEATCVEVLFGSAEGLLNIDIGFSLIG
jgi:hypothetical protein